MPRLLLAVLIAVLLPATAHAAVPAGADYQQTYIDTPDGESLHVDVLRPKGVSGKVPVIAIVSPYLGHSGGGTAADPSAEGPSERFKDLFDGAKVFQRGYAVVMVDLRGSGGSSGCLDILGPGEQTDIKTAVEWAASQPWSNGRVGMYGKSYDGNTGVVGAALRPKGLHAVVAQQVVGDRYSGSYSNGVRYLQSLAYPGPSYGVGAELGWTFSDDAQYAINSFSQSADCQADLAGHYNPDPSTEFWQSRDFVKKGRGSTVPFLMTHGFVDANTNIGAKAIDFFNGLAGEKRLWLGWWDHVRGNDTVGNKLAMGRTGWFDEVMRFYDRHLKGIEPTVKDPAIAVQGSDGKWRSEQAWPPADAQSFAIPLNEGSYADDGRNNGSNDSAAGAGGSGSGDKTGDGVWTVTPPLPHPAHLAGIPRATVKLSPQVPDSNLVVNVYDIGPDNKATMVSRGATLADPLNSADVPMYPSEWTFAPGHRIGVLVSGANSEAWLHAPTNTEPQVGGGTVTLPLLRTKRASDLPGAPAPRLAEFKETAPFDVAADVVAAATRAGLVPPAQVDPPAGSAAAAAAAGDAVAAAGSAASRAGFASPIAGRTISLRYSVRLMRRPLRTALRRGIPATATCSSRCTLAVTLKQGRRTVATGRVARAFTGRRKLTIRFTRSAKRSLARKRSARLSVSVSARDALGRRDTSRGRLALRR